MFIVHTCTYVAIKLQKDVFKLGNKITRIGIAEKSVKLASSHCPLAFFPFLTNELIHMPCLSLEIKGMGCSFCEGHRTFYNLAHS